MLDKEAVTAVKLGLEAEIKMLIERKKSMCKSSA